mgnify:CR=1
DKDPHRAEQWGLSVQLSKRCLKETAFPDNGGTQSWIASSMSRALNSSKFAYSFVKGVSQFGELPPQDAQAGLC